MKFFRYLSLSLLILCLGVTGIVFFVPGQEYIRYALYHRQAQIDNAHIFANRQVPTATPQVWPRDSRYGQVKLSPTALDSLGKYRTTAFVLLQDGHLLLEHYADTGSDTTRSNSFSMAKSVVALLVGVALQEGKIQSLDQAIGDYLPRFAEAPYDKITIRHLLTMSSGLEWDETYSSLFSITTKAYYGHNLPSLLDHIPVKEAPGKVNRYQGVCTLLLAEIVSQATQTELSTYTAEKLWKPLGAEHPALWSLDRKGGTEKSFCCFNATARDFARLGQLVLNYGRWEGKSLLDSAYIAEATRPATHLVDDEQGQPVHFYGFQFWIIKHQGQEIPYMRGILGQYVFVLREQNAVLVRLGHDRAKQKRDFTPIDVFAYLDIGLELLKNHPRVLADSISNP
jgi:CubicO group peptidase (beta-lactamase class C family)